MTKRYFFVFLLFVSFAGFAQTAGKLSFYKRTLLSKTVNSDQDEGGSIVSTDGQYLFFVRTVLKAGNRRELQQDVFYSVRKGDGTYETAVSMGEPVNNSAENTVAGISRDGNTIFLNGIYVSKRKIRPGVSSTKRSGKGWGVPQPLDIDYSFPSEGFYAAYVTPDESVIILSMEGPGTIGDEDLYVVKRNAQGGYDKPVSLGNTVNSKGYETTPFLANNGKTLYFASNGHGGLGDADIFKSTRLDDSWTNWSTPENLGSKINTQGFDGSFSMTDAGDAYFTSGEGDAGGPGDIYGISMVEPQPAVADTSPKVANQPAENDEPKAVTKARPQFEKAEDLPVELEIEGANKFEPITFFYNSFTIPDAKKKVLALVVETIKTEKTSILVIEGYADNVGPGAYNKVLSGRRAAAIKKYLLNKGVSKERMRIKAMGESRPIADNSTEEGRMANRRVEIGLKRLEAVVGNKTH